MALRNGDGQVDQRFNILEICQRYGWTYSQYLSNPLWFLDLLGAKLEADGEHARLEAEKNG